MFYISNHRDQAIKCNFLSVLLNSGYKPVQNIIVICKRLYIYIYMNIYIYIRAITVQYLQATISVTSWWVQCLSQITSVSISDHSKHQTSSSLAFVKGIHQWTVDSHHKGHWRRKRFNLMTSSWYDGNVVWVTYDDRYIPSQMDNNLESFPCHWQYHTGSSELRKHFWR